MKTIAILLLALILCAPTADAQVRSGNGNGERVFDRSPQISIGEGGIPPTIQSRDSSLPLRSNAAPTRSTSRSASGALVQNAPVGERALRDNRVRPNSTYQQNSQARRRVLLQNRQFLEDRARQAEALESVPDGINETLVPDVSEPITPPPAPPPLESTTTGAAIANGLVNTLNNDDNQ